MKKILRITVIVLLLMTIFTIIPNPIVKNVVGIDRTVSPGGGADYTAIQDAINVSSTGDIIYVWEGIYEEFIIINQTVSIIGNSTTNTTIDGLNNTLNLVTIEANWVNISNIAMVNFTNRGVRAVGYHNLTIENLKITCHERTGINLQDCQDSTVANNSFPTNHYQGVEFYNTSNSVISNNTMVNSNGDGIELQYSNNNNITGNNVDNAANGIVVWSSSNNNIFLNTIENSRVAGMQLVQSSTGNMVYKNNFISSAEQHIISYSGNSLNNFYPLGGNYYDNYTGVDDGSGSGNHRYVGDNIGDTYYPVYTDEYPYVYRDGWLNATYYNTSSAEINGTPLPDEGDWIIGNYTTAVNGRVWVNGNITVNSTGTLIIDNAELIINSTTDNVFNIHINGTLEINNTIITNGDNTTNKFIISYQNLSATNRTTISNSTLTHTTLEIYNSRTNITDNIIKYSMDRKMPGPGLYIENCSPVVKGNSILYNGIGIVYINSTIDLQNNTIRSNLLRGVYAENCSGDVKYNTITNNKLGGIYSVNSSLNFLNNIVNNNYGYGGRYTEGSVITASDNYFNSNSGYLFVDNVSVLESSNEYYNSTSAYSYYDYSSRIYGNANFTDTNIHNSRPTAFYGHDANINFYNGSITGDGYMFDLKGNSKIVLVNTPHNRNYVFNDTESNVTVKWYVNIHTVNDSTPLQTWISIFDVYSNNITYTQTNAAGYLNYTALFEYSENKSTRKEWSPHVITAYRTTLDYRSIGKVKIDREENLEIDFGNIYEKVLIKGWNMISFPITFATNYTISELIEDINADGGDVKYVVTKELDTGLYKSLIYSEGGTIGTDEAMSNKKGYYIYTELPCTITITGAKIIDSDVSLIKGYNFVPIYHTNNLYTIAEQIGISNIDTITIKTNYYQTYRPNSDSPEIGEGYWAQEGDAIFIYTKRVITWETEV